MEVKLTERRDVELYIKQEVSKNNKVSNKIKKSIRHLAMQAYDVGVEMQQLGFSKVEIDD